MYRFPGSRLFEVVLVLPLAFPAYVLAYAYTDFLSHPGPVQSTLAGGHRLGAARLLVPERPLAAGRGADADLRLLPLRLPAGAHRLRRSSRPRPISRRGRWGGGRGRAFFRVSLPIARPAIAAGVLLAIMETIADYGTVAYFNVRTFSTGIYQAWFAMQDRAAAAQLALCLLAFALMLAAAERIQRGQARSHLRGGRLTATEPQPLAGVARLGGGGASAALPVVVGFLLPAVVLATMAAGRGRRIARPALPRLRRPLADAGRHRGGGDGGRRGAGRLPARGCAPGRAARALRARRRARLRGAGGGDRRGAAGALRRARQR